MVDNITAQQPATGRTGRATNIVLWVLQVLLAAGFAMSAVAKFTATPQAVAVFEAMGTAGWMPYAIGTLEVAGAIGLLIPRLCGTAAWAFVALMVGAVLTHLMFGGDPTPAIGLLVFSAVIAWGRRSNAAALLAGRSRS
jgi:putative oxidoreductase